MPRTARARYQLAAALWALTAAWAAAGPYTPDASRILVGLAITATVCAAVLERDERIQQTIRLAWWAGTVHPATIPAQATEAHRRG